MKMVDANGKPIGTKGVGWDSPKDFFGATWSHIPVVVRPLQKGYFGNHPIPKIKNLMELAIAYNNQLSPDKANKKMKDPYTLDQFDNMVDFVIWTKDHFKVDHLTVPAHHGMK